MAFLALAACASGPNLARVLTVEPGRRITVRLMQFSDGRVFTLQNDSSGSAAEVYSDTRVDAMTKVVPDDMLQRLLDVFADNGLFVNASGTAPAEVRDALVVQQDERRFVFHRGTLGPGGSEQAQAFQEAKAYFLSAYNQATAYHSSTIHIGDMRKENARVQDGGDAAKRKLEQLKGKQQ